MPKITRILSGGLGIQTPVCGSQPGLMPCTGLRYSLVMLVIWDPLGNQVTKPGEQFVSLQG